MSLTTPRNVFATASFRLTLAYAGTFVAALLAIMIIGGIALMLYLDHEFKERVDDDIAELTTIYNESGDAGVIRAIDERAEDSVDTGLSYRFGTADGDVLAGRADIPAFDSGWITFVPPGNDPDEEHMAQAARLSDRRTLIVAVDAETLSDAREFIFDAAAATLAIAVPLALVCGWMMAAMVLRRIEAITDTTLRIREGGLHARVPVRGSGDEFDRLAVSINAMLDSIEALTRNIQQVSVGIAHDLKTPLTRVRNRLETLRDDAADLARFEKPIDRAITEVGALMATFEALLRIGQIDAGTRRSGFKTVDLSQVVAELAETYAVVAEDGGKTLQASVEPDITVQGDRELLAQMIVNLVENAIEHTPAATTITVRLAERDGRVMLIVADDGPGIPEADRARVFERFFRLDRSRQVNGSGLGLSIVSAVAKLHDAVITLADNHPGLRAELCFPA
jgi:signal transduction histidine kinase